MHKLCSAFTISILWRVVQYNGVFEVMIDTKLSGIISELRCRLEGVLDVTPFDEPGVIALCEVVLDFLDNLTDYVEEKQ